MRCAKTAEPIENALLDVDYPNLTIHGSDTFRRDETFRDDVLITNLPATLTVKLC